MTSKSPRPGVQPQQDGIATIQKLPGWATWLLPVITALVYSNSLTNGFTNFDDNFYILHNPFITSVSGQNIRSVFTVFYQGNYHPLALLLHMFTYAVAGFTPFAYHALNLSLHLINTWLVWQLAGRLSKNDITALVTAALFALHPMHVESVAWVSELKDVLYTAFYLASILAYLNIDSGKNKTVGWFLCLLAFVASLLSKPAAVTLPFVLLLIDAYRGHKWTGRILKLLPFFALALVFGVVNIYAQQQGGAIRNLAGTYTIAERFFLFCYGLSAYLVMLVAPVHLSAMHYLKHNAGEALPALYYAAPILPLTLVVLVYRARTFRRELVFGGLFFLAAISVMLQIITVGSAVYTERYTYIASIGVFYVAGQAISATALPGKRKMLLGVAVVYTALCSVLTIIRIPVWKDGETLFTDVIEKEPESYFGYWMRATQRNEQGKLEEAIADYNESIERKQDFEDLYYDRGHALQEAGRLDGAVADFTSAIALKPDMAEAWNDRGWAMHLSGDSVNAINDILKAIQLKPDFAEALNNAGAVLMTGGNFQAALPYFDRAIQLKPEYGWPYFNRGSIKARLGNYNAALADFNTLVQMEPENANAIFTRGLVKFSMKDGTGACSDWQQAAGLGHAQAPQMVTQYCH